MNQSRLGEEAGSILHEIDQTLAITSDPDVKMMLESLHQAVSAALAFEDKWWEPISGVWSNGNTEMFKIEDIKKLAQKTQMNTATNPLLAHGKELKTGHAIGAGFGFTFPDQKPGANGKPLPPRYQKILDDPINQYVVFGDQALKAISDKEYTSGNVFIGWNRATNQATRIPLSQITGIITDDADTSFVKYYQRTYAIQNDIGKSNKKVVEWLPADLHYRSVGVGNIPAGIRSQDGNSVPINKDIIVIPFQPNLMDEQVLALPSCFAAVPWALAYSSYMKGGVKLVEALSSIAFLLKSKHESKARAAAAKAASGKVGGVMIGDKELELSQVPRANAVDLNTGRPILSLVASALGLSTGSLATSVLEGGYASTAAVTAIEKSYAQARQRAFEAFFVRLFAIIGLSDGRIDFNRLDADPIHRVIQSAGIMRTLGGISQREYRTLGLELLDIEGDADDLPEPDEFVWAKKGILPSFLTDDEDLKDLNSGGSGSGSGGGDPQGSPLPSQGNSGAVGALDSE